MSISCDSVFSNKVFAEKLGGISFPMLSDFYPHGKAAQTFGVFNEKGFSKRACFLIDKAGTIRFSKVWEKGIPENNELIAEIKKL